MIHAERLTKRFGPVTAVEEVTFRVARGEVLGFLGPNGAGKSTTLRILCGWWPPSAGRAAVDGHDLLRDSLGARRRIGYLPENFAAPPELRVAEYLGFRARLKSLRRREARRRTGEVADRLGLGERLGQTIGSLSRGFRQRVGLADALLADPPALLLDEPFTGLDPLQRQEFREFLRDLAHREGKAVLFSSHVLPEVEDLADRLLILHRGRARLLGDLKELLHAARREAPLRLEVAGDPGALAAALADAPGLGEACPVVGRDGRALLLRPQDEDARRALLRLLVARDEDLRELRPLTPSLEELFRRQMAEAEAGEDAR